MKNESFLIYEYDKKYLKQIVELFTNTIHNINNKDYTKEQLNAWANQRYDVSITTKPFFEKFGFMEVKKKRNC